MTDAATQEGTAIPNPATAEKPSEASAPQTIFDQTESPTPETTTDTQGNEQPVGQWWLDDGIQGKGDRPEYLQQKFSKITDQAKAYNELQKKFGEFKGAPESYDLNKLPEHIQKDSPLIQNYAKIFKEMNLSQEGFERVVNEFVKTQEEFSQVKPQEILKELGPTGNEVIGRVGNWIKNNFSAEEQARMKAWSMEAKDILLLDKLRASTPISRAPTNNELQGMGYGYETSKAVEAEKAANWDKYKSNPAYASEISRRYQDALMREGHPNQGLRKR